MGEFLKNLKYAWTFSKSQKNTLILFLICNIVLGIIGIIVPIYSAKEIVALTGSLWSQLVYVVIVIFIIEIIRNISNYFANYFSSRIYRQINSNLQVEVSSEILRIESKKIESTSSGTLIQRINGDTSTIADVFSQLVFYSTDMASSIGVFIAIFLINKYAFVFILVASIISYMIDKKRVNVFGTKRKEVNKRRDAVTGFTGELVRGAQDVKMLNAENSFIDELKVRMNDLNDVILDRNVTNFGYHFLRGSFHDLSDLLFSFLCIYLILNNNLSIASVLVLSKYMNQVFSVSNTLSHILDLVKEFNISAERIFNLINSAEFPKEKFGAKHLNKVHGDFEFKDVCFSYDDKREVLNNLSFKINANTTVAFVGKSGAGKTTIFNLLCKMYDIDAGSITIDGIDIRELDKDSIRGNITIISQNPYIFNMSFKENLRLVKQDVTDKEIKDACKLACLDDFIESLPDKYDTIVGEGGVNLSGGQRQRLAIARALVQKTEIILFDEATSALDNETQADIQDAINNMKKEYTILIIAHRLSTIVHSDRILFLNDGKIEAQGSHKYLLKHCQAYKKLYESELQK